MQSTVHDHDRGHGYSATLQLCDDCGDVLNPDEVGFGTCYPCSADAQLEAPQDIPDFDELKLMVWS